MSETSMKVCSIHRNAPIARSPAEAVHRHEAQDVCFDSVYGWMGHHGRRPPGFPGVKGRVEPLGTSVLVMNAALPPEIADQREEALPRSVLIHFSADPIFYVCGCVRVGGALPLWYSVLFLG